MTHTLKIFWLICLLPLTAWAQGGVSDVVNFDLTKRRIAIPKHSLQAQPLDTRSDCLSDCSGPVSELDYRLSAYGESIGVEDFLALKKVWHECGAEFDPRAHHTEFNNAFSCFLVESDSKLKAKFEVVDRLASQVKFHYNFVTHSQPGALSNKVFESTMMVRMSELANKLKALNKETTSIRDKVVLDAGFFNLSLEGVGSAQLGRVGVDDNFVAAAIRPIKSLFDKHNLSWELAEDSTGVSKYIREIFYVGNVLIKSGLYGKDAISIIQFDPKNSAKNPYLEGKACRGNIQLWDDVRNFKYMRTY